VALGILGAGVLALRTAADRLFSTSSPGPLVTVTIPRGAGTGDIGQVLERAGVVSSAAAFQLRAQGESADFLPGIYRLHRHESWNALFAALESGPPARPTKKLVIPEGFAIRDIAARVSRVGLSASAYEGAVKEVSPPDGFLQAGEQPSSLEGFLFPATYDVPQPGTADELVQDQLAAFKQNATRIDLRYARSRNLTAYDVVKIASMIEREAGAPQDRARISAVIYNRLRRHMPLGIDATIQYAVGSWRPLTAADLRIASPYNSRTHRGLPPTPISNPGLAAWRAAARPAKVDYLYYLAIPHDPRHRSVFFSTAAAFEAYKKAHPQ
jgi:uncharacterized YceG family protein